MIINENPVVQHVTEIKYEIIKNVNVDLKINACARKIIVGILAHAFVKIASI